MNDTKDNGKWFCSIAFQWPLLKTENFGEHGWNAYLEGVPGMVTTGATEEDAINELMTSIKVLLLYKRDNVT